MEVDALCQMKIFVINLLCEMTAMWCEQSGDQIIQFEWDRGLTILQPVLGKTVPLGTTDPRSELTKFLVIRWEYTYGLRA